MITLKKRIASLLLALVVAITMMTGMSVSVFAEEEGESYSVDLLYSDETTSHVSDLSLKWLQDNTGEAQIFPFASKKNNGKIGYKIVKGVPTEEVLEHLGLTDAELDGASLVFCDSATGTSQPNGFSLPISQLEDAVYVMTGAWDAENNVDARTYLTNEAGERLTVTPVIATQISATTYKTYAEAEAAAMDTTGEGFWSADKTSCYIGNTSEDYPGHAYAGLDAKGQIANPAVDCNGKNAINNFQRIIVKPAAAVEEFSADTEVSIERDQKISLDYNVAPLSAEYNNQVTAVSSDESIVKVTSGVEIEGVAEGEANVTLSCGELTATVKVTVTIPANEHIQVVLNAGTEDEKEVGYLDLSWLKENTAAEAQIFPFASKKNNGKIGYKVVKGVPTEAVLEHLGLTDAELDGSSIVLCDTATGTKQPNGFSLPISQLKDAVYVMTGAWDAENNVDARTYLTNEAGEKLTVTPVIATQYSATTYKSYAEAEAAAKDTTGEGFWSADKTSCYIGNTSEDYPGHAYAGLDAKGQIANPAVDCNGKNAINNFQRINIITADAADAVVAADTTITLTNTKPYSLKYAVEPMSAAIKNPVVITTTDSSVVAVSGDTIIAKGIGSAVVTITCGEEAQCSIPVTVTKAAFPVGKVTNVKVTNVKTRKAKVTSSNASTAAGYEVYKAKKKTGKYTKVKTTKTLSYKSGKLTKGKKYYYKVRAYRIVNGKKVYGSYSTIKYVKIKK